MFEWPTNVYAKTKVKIAQILWTLWLDFEGEIADSDDAVKELLDALRGHGVEIADSEVMGWRIILPHLDGGKYGHYIRRVVIGQRTKAIKLVSDLPDDSHLPDGAGGVDDDDRIDRQLFGGMAIEPARGTTRDHAYAPTPARGNARDDSPVMSARGTTRDHDDGTQPLSASGSTDDPAGLAAPARGETRDHTSRLSVQPASGSTDDDTPVMPRDLPAPGVTGDDVHVARDATRDIAEQLDDLEDPNDLDAHIRRLDDELAELAVPVVVDADAGGRPQDLVDTIVSLMGELETTLAAGVAKVAPAGRSETDWNELLETKAVLTSRLAAVLRRAKGLEARVQEIERDKNRTIAGLEARLGALQQENVRLSTNIDALLRGEKAGGEHVRAAQRFLAERPSDRPEGGRNRRRRTTGSDSTLAYSAGP